MRLEANISLKKESDAADYLPDYKVECKNINSFRFMEMAINYEMQRQAQLLDNGQVPIQETRGFNAATAQTFSQRSKEAAEDYRYFPDPDLPPIEFNPEDIEQIRQSLPELPEQYAARLSHQYQLSLALTERLVKSKQRAKFFEQILILAKEAKIDGKKIVNALLNKKIDYQLTDEPKDVINKYQQANKVEAIDQALIEKQIQAVLQENSAAVKKYQAGKTEVLAFLIGQSMRKIAKKVDANLVKNILLEQLKNKFNLA